jgi:hypothetical protein
VQIFTTFTNPLLNFGMLSDRNQDLPVITATSVIVIVIMMLKPSLDFLISILDIMYHVHSAVLVSLTLLILV